MTNLNLKPICTWSFDPWFKSPRWDSTEKMLACACASIISVNRYIGRPSIYCDSLTASVLDELAVPADFIVIYDDLYNKEMVDSSWWMFPKLVTYSLQDQPYFHFDLDFVMLQPWPESIWECDVVFQNFEQWEHSGHIYLKSFAEAKLKLPDIFKRWKLTALRPPNVGFLMIKNMEFNKLYSSLAIETVKVNARSADQIEPGQLANCIVEQQLLGLLLREHLVSHRAFFNDQVTWMNRYFNHFIGENKNSQVAQRFLAPFISSKIKDQANRLNSLRVSRKH